jgi:hypothetical protein
MEPGFFDQEELVDRQVGGEEPVFELLQAVGGILGQIAEAESRRLSDHNVL